MSDLNRLRRDFEKAAGLAASRAGGVVGAAADRIRDEIASTGQSRGYSGEVRARREKRGGGDPPTGYVFAEGNGYFFSTYGSPTWGPDDFITSAVDRQISQVADELADAAADLL